MKNAFADLHVHTFASDGSMSPEEIVEDAVANGVGLLAVADHDVTDGSVAAQKLCKNNGILCIPAVEIDTAEGDVNFHVLGYGVDFADAEFAAYLAHTKFLLDEYSIRLIERMSADYNGISFDDYHAFAEDKRLGGWKALHYFREKGLTSLLKEGVRLYAQYGLKYSLSGFSTIAAAAWRIRRAGGYAVLAHPGETIDTADMESFRGELRRILALGVDGIECYYPTHSQDVTRACLDVCRERDAIVTAGSDCHGVFGKTRVGEMDIPMGELRLKGLLP